jgi:regulator of cell morphogenesis and NO signaling
MLQFPLQLILDYIKKSHTYYLEVKAPHIEEIIEKLIKSAGDSRLKELSLINKFFKEYMIELEEHIREEENNVYPYIQSINEAFLSGNIDKKHIEAIKVNPIKKYEEGHTNIEDKLFDLKNIIIKYLPPVNDYAVSNTLLIELFRLERDLNDHSRIEEKVLVPKVQCIENEILKSQK